MNLKYKLIIPAAALSMAAAARACYESRHFTTEYYDIVSGKIPEAFDGFRFIMLSDLHNYDFDHGNRKLLRQIDTLKPDVVLIAGDMIDASPGADMTVALKFLQDLCDQWTVYFGNGNHEQRIRLYPQTYGDMYEKWSSGIAHKNLHLLRNTHMTLERDGSRMNVYGLEMDRIYYKRLKKTKMSVHYLDETLGKCSRDSYKILIAHNPLYFEEYAGWGADLVLSGHVHGGVVILPYLGGVISPQIQLFPEYYAGEYVLGASHMILSRGLHMHSIPVRLFNMPELSCVTLHRS